MADAIKQKIGFLGVGIWACYPLTVIAHRNRERVEDLLGRGAHEAQSVPELAAGADVVTICVNSADTVAVRRS